MSDEKTTDLEALAEEMRRLATAFARDHALARAMNEWSEACAAHRCSGLSAGDREVIGQARRFLTSYEQGVTCPECFAPRILRAHSEECLLPMTIRLLRRIAGGEDA